MTRKDLEQLIGEPPKYDSTRARGLPYYGGLKTAYPHHWSSFMNAHRRGNVHEAFERTVDGFIAFILYLGPIPEDMERPTIGRIDHSRGYEPGNFRWQALSENARESNGDPEHRKLSGQVGAKRSWEPGRRDLKKHRQQAAANLNDGPNRSRHNRWHVKRGVRKEGCPFCEEA